MRRFIILLIQIYKVSVSPILHSLMPIRSGCRFPQTCSEYAMDMIREQGVMKGAWSGFIRLATCHPVSFSKNR